MGWTVFAAVFVYWVIFETLKGTTLGKMVFRLHVLALNERPIWLRQSLVRNIFKMIGLGGSFVTFFCILFTARSQRFGDMVAATIVVKDVTKKAKRRAEVGSMPIATVSSPPEA